MCDIHYLKSTSHFDCSHATLSYEQVVENPESFFSILRQNGVVFVSGIMTLDERTTAQQLSEKYLEEITADFPTPYDGTDPKTWTVLRELCFLHSNLVQNYQVAASKVAWYIRKNHRLLNVWAILLGCRVCDLVASMGTLAIQKPPEVTNPNSDAGYLKARKLHCDQSFTDPKEQYQSLVTVNDVEIGDATFRYLDNSSKYQEAFRQRFGNQLSDKNNFTQLADKQVQWYLSQPDVTEKFFTGSGGSLVIWDSRTIHSCAEPMLGRPNPKSRLVSHNCYTDRANLGSNWNYDPNGKQMGKQMKRRLAAVFNNTTQTHTAEVNKNFPKTALYFVSSAIARAKLHGTNVPRFRFLSDQLANIDDNLSAQLVGIPEENFIHFLATVRERRLRLKEIENRCTSEHKNCFDPKCWFFCYDLKKIKVDRVAKRPQTPFQKHNKLAKLF